MAGPADGPPPVAGEESAWPWLAHAVAHRPVTVRVAGANQPTFGNGEVIQLANGKPGDDRVAVVAQALLLRAGSLSDEVLVELRGRPVVARRYLLLETLRTGADFELGLPQWFCAAVGSWPELRRSTDRADSLARAAGDERLPDTPDAWGTILGRRDPATRGGRADGALGDKTRRRDAAIDPNEETERSLILRILSAPLPGNSLSTMFRNRRGVRGASPGGMGGANLPDGEAVTVATGVTEYVVRSAAPHPGRAAPRVVRSRLYPEWDGAAGLYRPEWCRLFEVAPKHAPVPFPTPVVPALVQHRLRRVALGMGRRPGAASGDEIDFDRLVEHRIHRRARSGPDHERIYVDRQRRRPEVSITVVVDASGSTQDQRRNRSILDQERQLCAALLDACQAVDIRSSAFGFCSQGRESIFAIRIKDFDEPFGAGVRRRLAGLRPSGFTRIGAALRHATATVPATSGTPRRVLLLLTDGFPYDDGYEADHASADTARALAEARAAGLGCACLAVGSDQHAERLARLFDGSAAHAATAGATVALNLAVDLIEHCLRTPSALSRTGTSR